MFLSKIQFLPKVFSFTGLSFGPDERHTDTQVLKCWWDKTSIPQVLSLMKLGLYCYNPQRSFGLLWATSPPPAVCALPLFSFLPLAFSSYFPQSYLAAPPAPYWCLFWCLPGPSSELISLAAFLWLHVCICVCVCVFVCSKDKAYGALNKSWNLNNKVHHRLIKWHI